MTPSQRGDEVQEGKESPWMWIGPCVEPRAVLPLLGFTHRRYNKLPILNWSLKIDPYEVKCRVGIDPVVLNTSTYILKAMLFSCFSANLESLYQPPSEIISSELLSTGLSYHPYTFSCSHYHLACYSKVPLPHFCFHYAFTLPLLFSVKDKKHQSTSAQTPVSGLSFCCQCFSAQSMKAFPFRMIPGFTFSSSYLSNPHMAALESGHHICFTFLKSAHLTGSLKTATVVVCLGLPV